ncbi:aldo/keto reductase [Novosphingobium sp. ZN18A2]|uniref:aldo/keto reductase n=1 Tax=Novosphingobium sp. ZN18A2 TaxID=3079861 RepID=UPI0030D5EF12
MSHPAISGIPLVLGGNVFGWTADRDRSFEVLDAFYEAGGRMIDTAECYSFWVPGHSGGESETVIGEWLESRGVRGDMRIATKTNVDAKPGGLKPDALREHLDKSLERLRTDYADLFYSHRDDPETPQDEVAQGFADLIAEGRVREAGASNFSAQRLSGALDAAKRLGVPGYGVLQNEYNLVARDAYGADLQTLCVERGVAMLPFYGLASGFLSGKYRTEADLSKSPRGGGMKKLLDKGAAVLAAMDEVSSETGSPLAEIALAWLLSQPGIAAPIASATSVEQLAQLIAAVSLKLDDDQIARLTASLG